jgi:hypothetical protein
MADNKLPIAMIPCYTPEEVQAATNAIQQVRGGITGQPDLANRLYQAMAYPKLPTIYRALLQRLYEVPEHEYIEFSMLSEKLGQDPVRVRNLFGKISQRIAPIMTPEENQRYRSPRHLLVDTLSDQSDGKVPKTLNRLTKPGREAVAKFLAGYADAL